MQAQCNKKCLIRFFFQVGLPQSSVSELFYKLSVCSFNASKLASPYSIAEYSLLMSLYTLNDLLVVLGMRWKTTNSIL